MVEILSSRVFFKNSDGGITKRIPEHFWKRIVVYKENGEEKTIEILNNELRIDATIEEIETYIMTQ